jgi:hypothetical protein
VVLIARQNLVPSQIPIGELDALLMLQLQRELKPPPGLDEPLTVLVEVRPKAQ